MRPRTVGIALFMGAAIGGSGSSVQIRHRTPVFRGEFAWEFERSEFRPCASQERWWLTPASDTLERRLLAALDSVDPLKAGVVRAQRAYLEIAGDTTPRGRYGHMGTYDHEVKVTAVLKVDASGGCKTSGNGGPPNEALLLPAWDKEAAGSLRSRAAIMIERRRRAPRR